MTKKLSCLTLVALLLGGQVVPTCLTACVSVDRRLPWDPPLEPEEVERAQSTQRPFETPTEKPPKVRYTRLPGHGPVLAITFDDGPRPWTLDLLDSLKERGIKATFFVVGQAVAAYPEVAKRIVAEGHEIANHTWSHPRDMARMPRNRVRREIQACHDLIVKTTGVVPRLFRPPGGSFTAAQSQWLYDEMDYVNIMWSVDPRDWRRPGVDAIKRRIVERVHHGAIILAHDLHRPTVRAMPATLDALIGKGYEFLRVSELLALDRPKAKLTMIPARVGRGRALKVESRGQPRPVKVVRSRARSSSAAGTP